MQHPQQNLCYDECVHGMPVLDHLAAPWRSTLPSCRATHAQGESEDRLRMTFVSAMVEPSIQYLWGKYKDKVDEI